MGPRHKTLGGTVSATPLALFDTWLFGTTVTLFIIGWLMVASSSVGISQKYYGYPAHYLIRQGCYLALSLGLGLGVVQLPLKHWLGMSYHLLFFSLISLLLVLVPPFGHAVNGSHRWLRIGPLVLQVSELVKVAVIIYMASFLSKAQDSRHDPPLQGLRPLLIIGVIALLLLLEPDFGAVVVVTVTMLAMLFVAGMPWRVFLTMMALAVVLMAFLAVASPYRLARMTSFVDPWAHPYGKGYQLTQSLIAFGRGGVAGVGLGQSLQKLSYLPEAHTDFLLAILAEEWGLIGVLLVLLLYVVLFVRGMAVAQCARRYRHHFSAYLAFGLTFCIVLQAMVNVAVNMGLLPTKGLTLPMMSSGGSSLLACSVAVALLMRIDYENRWEAY